MKAINVMLSNLDGKVIPIGYEGENMYTRVRINCVEIFTEYPDATVSMVISPPTGSMYPAVIEKSGVMVVWDITKSILSSNGSGSAQLTFKDGETEIKSVIFGLSINRSLIADGEPPEPVQEWIDRAEETAHQIALTAKDEVIEQIQDAAEEARESIPEDYTQLSDDVSGLKSAIDSIIRQNPPIDKYLYKKDMYITTSGVETALSGYDTYKIPVFSGDMVLIKQTSGATAFYDGLNNDVIYHILNNGSYERVYVAGAGTHPNYYFFPNSTAFRSQFKVLAGENVTAVLMTVKRGNTDMVSVQHNDAVMVLSDAGKIDYRNTIVTLDDNNTLASNIYKSTTNMVKLADGYTVRTYRVLSGEKLVVPAKTTGINYYGFFINSSTLEISQINDAVFTAQADGFVETFAYSSDNITITVYPAKSINIDYSAIKNIPVSENPFTGLSAVAFGTSITYRGQEGQSGGYLQYLPELSGMTFDNQGIGNSTILGDMLTAIKAYTGYGNKDVCTLEGFVNDWFQGKALGTYTDDTEDTVCGCVRSAINYMLSQNRNMTMFLILDHYGRVYGTTDCSSTAKNANNQTQYQYYEEIAKVAESLAIPVIKLYADSQISENTGLNMYLADNIHPTALGAKQDAYTIWAKMRTYFPNQKLS